MPKKAGPSLDLRFRFLPKEKSDRCAENGWKCRREALSDDVDGRSENEPPPPSPPQPAAIIRGRVTPESSLSRLATFLASIDSQVAKIARLPDFQIDKVRLPDFQIDRPAG